MNRIEEEARGKIQAAIADGRRIAMEIEVEARAHSRQTLEKTKEEFTDDGWFRTGDLGRRDADGRVTIVGRSKDLIISGGYNVYPAEIEGYLNEMPGVAESAVVGVPHPDFGEGVIAVVVPRPGATLDAAAIVGTLKLKIANFKGPKRVFIERELPRNALGKVQKNLLRDAHKALFAA